MPEGANERAYAIIGKFSGTPVESLNESSDMTNVPGWDSLAHVELCSSLSKELGFNLNEQRIEECSSFVGIRRILQEFDH